MIGMTSIKLISHDINKLFPNADINYFFGETDLTTHIFFVFVFLFINNYLYCTSFWSRIKEKKSIAKRREWKLSAYSFFSFFNAFFYEIRMRNPEVLQAA